MLAPLAVVALVECAGCGGGDEGACVLRGELGFGPGIVFAQPGGLTIGQTQHATVIAADGTFLLVVPAPDTYGVRVVRGGEWRVNEVEVAVSCARDTVLDAPVVDWETTCDPAGRCEWVMTPPRDGAVAELATDPDPDLADNPVLGEPRVDVAGDALMATVDAADPDGDIARVIAHPVGTSIAVELAPPESIGGAYSTRIVAAEIDPGAPWLFVALDRGRSASPIIEVVPAE